MSVHNLSIDIYSHAAPRRPYFSVCWLSIFPIGLATHCDLFVAMWCAQVGIQGVWLLAICNSSSLACGPVLGLIVFRIAVALHTRSRLASACFMGMLACVAAPCGFRASHVWVIPVSPVSATKWTAGVALRIRTGSRHCPRCLVLSLGLSANDEFIEDTRGN